MEWKTDVYGNRIVCETTSFSDNIYSPDHWNAPVIQEPENVFRAWDSFTIEGKTVRRIRILGHCYEDTYSGDVDLNRQGHFQIAQPVLMEFTDGSTFEIDYFDGSTVRMSVNQIPFDIGNDIPDSVDANIPFKQLLGQSIRGLKVLVSNQFPVDFTSGFGIDLDENQPYYIDKVIIDFTGDLCLQFGCFIDFCLVRLISLWDVLS